MFLKSLRLALSFILILLISSSAVAGEKKKLTGYLPFLVKEAAPSTCEQTLNVCIDTVNAAKNVIEVQNAAIQEARKQRDEAVTELSKSSSPLLPGWAWAVIGAAAATTTIMLVK